MSILVLLFPECSYYRGRVNVGQECINWGLGVCGDNRVDLIILDVDYLLGGGNGALVVWWHGQYHCQQYGVACGLELGCLLIWWRYGRGWLDCIGQLHGYAVERVSCTCPLGDGLIYLDWHEWDAKLACGCAWDCGCKACCPEELHWERTHLLGWGQGCVMDCFKDLHYHG